MTVPSTVNRNDYVGNGVTTVYPYTFQIFDQSHIEVWVQSLAGTVSKLTITTDYTVSGVGLSGGGNVTLNTALTSGHLLAVKLVLPLTQLTDLKNQGRFFGEVHERVFDRDIRIAQQLADQYSRSLKLPETEIGSQSNNIPSVFNRAKQLLGFDEDGNVKMYPGADNAELQSVLEIVTELEESATIQAGIATDKAVLTAADRVQTGLDVIATAADRVQTGLDRVQTGLDRTQTTADAATTTAARDAALLATGIWPTTAAGIGNGVAGTSGLVAGSGGTNGTFALAFSSGTQVLAPKGYFVVAGGAVTQVVITYKGYYSAGTPTISFAASSGLTGASVTAVMAVNTPINSYFFVPTTTPNLLTLYRVDTGPTATSLGTIINASAIPLATYYAQRHFVVQRNISGVLNLLLPAATIERAGAFVSISAPANNRYTEQPLSTSTTQRRHYVDPSTGTLAYVDSTTSPQPSYSAELLATSVNGVVTSGKYKVIGDMDTVPNLFPYGKNATEVTKTSSGQLVAISDSNLTALGFTYGWGNVSGSAFLGLDFDDAVESPYYFVRVYQQNDGTVVLPTVTITYTDGTNLQFNPSVEQTLSANTCSHSQGGRVAIGKKIASIIVGGTSMSTRDIRFCGVQIYCGQEPALWIDRLDYPTLLPMQTRLKAIEDAIFTYPVLSVAPVITGTKTVGSTLTCTTGTWTSTPSVSRYRYQWLRDGAILSGATSSTYVLQAGDANKAVTCRVKATNAKGSRVCSANPVGITGTVYVLHLLGQSNMIGWGTNGSIDRSIDTTDFRAREYTAVLGENQISDPSFESGVGSWAGSNATLTVASNKLTATITVASAANINIALTNLIIGQKYICQAKVGGTTNKALTFRLTAPQTQIFTTPKGSASYVDFEFTPSATTATLFVITTNTPAISDTITIEEVNIRPVLATGNGASIVESDPLTWPSIAQAASWGVCPASQASRDLLTAGASMVVLNPLSVGGAGLYNSVWAVGGQWQVNAVTQITKSVADYPVAGATHVLVWLQGEQDALNLVSQANYNIALTATLNSFRAITGLSTAKIIILGMMPEFIAANAGAPAIVSAQQAVATAIGTAVYVASPSGYAQGDVIHFNATGSRAIGSLIASNV